MCGITGYLRYQRDWNESQHRTLTFAMTDKLRHRGPDDAGFWVDSELGMALGHRRLSIIDLSPAGHQPMTSQDKSGVIVLNGEIYNFEFIRAELDAAGVRNNWRGYSDTEVLLAAIGHWGIPKTLEKLNGMFAFAYVDIVQKKLFLVRDRFGEKPLYIYQDADGIGFASEIKALQRIPNFNDQIDTAALSEFMTYAYIPAPSSIYQNISKLPPASYMEIDLGYSKTPPVITPYWSALDCAIQSQTHLIHDENDALRLLDDILRETIALRMLADVPLGAFLSGGIDSSMVVAMMQAQSSRPVKTYTIGFAEDDYNEAPHARVVANHLGTDHTEQIVNAAEAMAVIPHLPEFYDEPFADSSQIPTYLVSRLARRDVTVSLSGDAGDELFGGYNRYFAGAKLWQTMSNIPLPLRDLAAQAMTCFSPQQIDKSLGRLLPVKALGDKTHKLGRLLTAHNQNALYHRMHTFWPLDTVKAGKSENKFISHVGSFTDDMMLHDTINYLPNDILVKLDRASMAVGLESRVPFLDPKIFSFAWSLAPDLKIRDNQGKYLLRKLLYQYVPQSIVDRPKMGFGLPIADWLRGQLRDWAEDLISETALVQDGYLRHEPIIQKWQEHLSGRRNWQDYLWPVLMYMAWRRSV
jgi:asparagine synthase (glutamine-hydrolysing)